MTNTALLMMIAVCGVITIVTAYLFWKILISPAKNPDARREQWQSRLGLVLAMAGNAVGLGNFLRFPVQAIKNGGGAFLIPYLVCFLLMGIPLLLVEWSSGKYGGKFKQHSPPFILDKLGDSPLWKYIGTFGLFTTVIVASYYIYIESWALSYVFYSLLGVFQNMNQNQVTQFFVDYTALKSNIPIISWLICIVLHLYFLSRGVGSGIEKVAKVGMPLLLFFGIILAITGVTVQAGVHDAVNDAAVGLNFLWQPDFNSIFKPDVWLAAAGQTFFTLSVGMGAVQCYASYCNEKDDVVLNGLSSAMMNTFVEVVIGSAILIPISVGYLGLDEVKRLIELSPFGLAFETMPLLFQQWGTAMAAISGMMWFGILFFAGMTSSLAMGLSWTGFLKDRFGTTNSKAVITFGVAITLLGIMPVYFSGENVMSEFDYWAGTVSLVIFGTAEIILFAWVFGMDKGWQLITNYADIRLPLFYKFIIQYVTPFFLAFIFFGNIGNWVERLMLPVTPMVVFARYLMLSVFLGVGWLIYEAARRVK